MSGKAKLFKQNRNTDKHIVLTEADAVADLNGTPRPNNPTIQEDLTNPIHIEENKELFVAKKTTKAKKNAKSKN